MKQVKHTHNMQHIPLFAFRADSERLATTKLDSLVMPNLRKVVSEDGEIIICHFPFLVAERQIAYQ